MYNKDYCRVSFTIMYDHDGVRKSLDIDYSNYYVDFISLKLIKGFISLSNLDSPKVKQLDIFGHHISQSYNDFLRHSDIKTLIRMGCINFEIFNFKFKLVNEVLHTDFTIFVLSTNILDFKIYELNFDRLTGWERADFFRDLLTKENVDKFIECNPNLKEKIRKGYDDLYSARSRINRHRNREMFHNMDNEDLIFSTFFHDIENIFRMNYN